MRAIAPPKRLVARSRPRRGWVWALIAVIAVCIAVVAASPYALQYALQRWLYAQGAQQVQTDALRVNLFTGRIHITGLHVLDAEGGSLRAAELRTRFWWRGLLERRLQFETVSVRAAEAPLTAAMASLLAPRQGGARQHTWPVVVQRLELEDISLQLPGMVAPVRAHVAEATAGPWSSGADQPTEFSVRGHLADAPIRLVGHLGRSRGGVAQGSARLELDELALARVVPDGRAEGALSLHLKLHVQDGGDAPPRLSYEGTVRVESLRAEFADDSGATRLQMRRLLWAGDGALERVEEQWLLRQQGRLTLEMPQWHRPVGEWAADALEWHGRMQVDERATVLAEGSLDARLPRLHGHIGERRLHARRLQWKGTIGRGTLDVPGGFAAQGDLRLEDVAVQPTAEPAIAWQAQRAELRRLDVKGTYRATAQALQLSSFRALATGAAEGTESLRAGQVVVSDLALTHVRRFEAEQLQLQDLQLRLLRRADGTWSGLPALARATMEPGAQPGSWRLGRLEVHGANSTLRVEHYGLQPPLARTVRLAELSLGELDSARPQQLTPLSLHGTDDHGARVVAVGKLMPFSDTLNLALKTKISGIGLPSLGSYAARHLGYRTEAGVAALDSDLHVVDDQLRSINTLRLRGLRLSPANAASEPTFQQALGMPLPVAVALLQPARATLRLSVPVRADLHKSEPRLGVAIERALGESLRAAALRTAEQTLHPFAPAGSSASGLRLEPLRFRAGSAQLNTVARTYLKRVADLLRQRPSLRLEVCGVSARIDAAAAASELAQRRTDAVVHSLREDPGIDPRRLAACSPAAGNDRGLPRAELILR